MILDPDPQHMVRPIFVGVRGMGITMLAFFLFFYLTGVTYQEKTDKGWSYIAALSLAFLLHYIGAWIAIWKHRKRQRDLGEQGNA